LRLKAPGRRQRGSHLGRFGSASAIGMKATRGGLSGIIAMPAPSMHCLKLLTAALQYLGFADWDVLSLPMIRDMVWATIIALTAVSASNMLLWAWEAL
jgi:hypothetical protein